MVLLSVVPFTDLEHLYRIGVWLPLLGALASSVLIWASIDHRPALLGGRTLVWLGGISYALYLWHAPMLLLACLRRACRKPCRTRPFNRLGRCVLETDRRARYREVGCGNASPPAIRRPIQVSSGQHDFAATGLITSMSE